MVRDDPVERLTDAQLQCVRMVGAGPSKVIAKRLGLSPFTVDNHLKAAMQRLGAHTRHEAAEIVARADAARHSQDLASPPPHLAGTAASGKFEASFLAPVRGMAGGVHDVPVTFQDVAPVLVQPGRTGERRNGRTPLQTIGLVTAIAAGIAVIASAALPISQGFQAISNLVQPQVSTNS